MWLISLSRFLIGGFVLKPSSISQLSWHLLRAFLFKQSLTIWACQQIHLEVLQGPVEISLCGIQPNNKNQHNTYSLNGELCQIEKYFSLATLYLATLYLSNVISLNSLWKPNLLLRLSLLKPAQWNKEKDEHFRVVKSARIKLFGSQLQLPWPNT